MMTIKHLNYKSKRNGIDRFMKKVKKQRKKFAEKEKND